MQFLSQLPNGVLVSLVALAIILMGWMIKIIYSLIKKSVDSWDEKITSGFNQITTEFGKVDNHFIAIDRKVDLLFIEQQSSDFALDILISNGKRYSDLKGKKKEELIRDYEFRQV